MRVDACSCRQWQVRRSETTDSAKTRLKGTGKLVPFFLVRVRPCVSLAVALCTVARRAFDRWALTAYSKPAFAVHPSVSRLGCLLRGRCVIIAQNTFAQMINLCDANCSSRGHLCRWRC